MRAIREGQEKWMKVFSPTTFILLIAGRRQRLPVRFEIALHCLAWETAIVFFFPPGAVKIGLLDSET